MYDQWKSNHICKFDCKGTAGNMGPVRAKRIWERLEEKNKFIRYTQFYGDGDSKSFNALQNTHTGIHVKKLECVGHIQKRVGCRLQNHDMYRSRSWN